MCWGSVFCKLEHHANIKYGCLPHPGYQGCTFLPVSSLARVLQMWLFPLSFTLPAHFLPLLLQGENWHSGSGPLCHLAKSLEGRCSISDITTKSVSRFSERSLPLPPSCKGAGTFLCLGTPPPLPPSFSLWSRQSSHR